MHLYNKCLKLEITVFQSINIYDQYVDTWKLKVRQIVPDSRLTELVAPSVGIPVFNTFLYIASSPHRSIVGSMTRYGGAKTLYDGAMTQYDGIIRWRDGPIR